MTFRQAVLRARPLVKQYATVFPSVIVQPPPPPPTSKSKAGTSQGSEKKIGESSFDSKCIAALAEKANQAPLTTLISQYVQSAGVVLKGVNLPYESRPQNKVSTTDSGGIVLVAHCAANGVEDEVTVSSGFVLNATLQGSDEHLILTCAHTLEEIRQSPILSRQNTTTGNVLSGTFVVTSDGRNLHPTFQPVSQVVSSLPRSDLVLLGCKLPAGPAKALPVSPYPVPGKTHVQAHLVAHQKPAEAGWSPWLGGTWSKWVDGEILSYRDFSGRETQPGTYDALSHMVFYAATDGGVEWRANCRLGKRCGGGSRIGYKDE